jgi:hypothetical protein
MDMEPEDGCLSVLGLGEVTAVAFTPLADLNYIPVGQFYSPTAYRRTLSGVISSPIPFFWNIEKQQA